MANDNSALCDERGWRRSLPKTIQIPGASAGIDLMRLGIGQGGTPRLLLAGTLLAFHALALAWGGLQHSPTMDELGHLPAGLSHWMLGRGDLYRVNPPLVRMVAALPVLACEPQIDWKHYSTNSNSRSEFDVGRDFIAANSTHFRRYYSLARWACIPFSLIGALTCWAWSSKLYGPTAGFVALILWCVCPNVLGYGQLITPDVGAAALGITAAYAFWRWLNTPTWSTTVTAGVAMGLAELTKSTWVVLFVLWPALTVFWHCSAPKMMRLRLRACKLAVTLLIALYVLNLVYAFEGSFSLLGDYQFSSRAFRGPPVSTNEYVTTGNRFHGTILAQIPIPLPRNYLQGIDLQRKDFEDGGWSYLRGRSQKQGWYYYYLYALLIKVPLGTWVIGALAFVVSVIPGRWLGNANIPDRRRDSCKSKRPVHSSEARCRWRDEAILLAPAISILLLVSSQTGFNRHFRYVLPILPFVFVWVSKVGRLLEPAKVHFSQSGSTVISARRRQSLARRAMAAIAAASLVWLTSSSLYVYPHSLSYFNELVGGPTRGHLYLGSSSVDWGQDMWYLQSWYDEHQLARPLHLAMFVTDIDPHVVGIDCQVAPSGPVMNRVGTPMTANWPWRSSPDSTAPYSSDLNREQQTTRLGPFPGWFVVSANILHRPEGDYEYFQEFEPVDRIGYSTHVYHITPADANRVRRRLGLPALDELR